MKQFDSSEEVQEAVRSEMRKIDEDVFRRQIDLLILHCDKVIAARGNYVVPSD
jgi:hypothetical protein